jgi:hypothetical protein
MITPSIVAMGTCFVARTDARSISNRLPQVIVPYPSQNGGLNTALDDASGDSMTGQASRVMQVKLIHEALAVFFDRFDTDV